MQLLRVTRLRVLQSMQPLRCNAMRLRRFSCTAQLCWQLQKVASCTGTFHSSCNFTSGVITYLTEATSSCGAILAPLH